MTDWSYDVQVLRPDDTVVESHTVTGSLEASEFLEERLQNYPEEYWGRISVKGGKDEHI